MLYAALDIHKSVIQAAELESDSGALREERFPASRQALDDWAMRASARVSTIGVEATSGWRWVVACLMRHGLDVRLIDPGQARGDPAPARRHPPAQAARERRRWAQRLHALLVQEGWPCARGRLLTASGRRWADGLSLDPGARAYLETALAMIAACEAQLEPLEAKLRSFARSDRRCQTLLPLFGVGPILACHLLAEIGTAARFRRARQLVRAAGLDPVVEESGERRRRGRLAKQGSPYLRFALVEAAQHARRRTSPDHARYERLAARLGPGRAKLTIARLIGARAYHLLRELELESA
jgi:transposase